MPTPTNQFEIPKLCDVTQPIDGNPEEKHLLSMAQLDQADIIDYLAAADDIEAHMQNLRSPALIIAQGIVLKAVMGQPSTRTGGSMTTAIAKLGGHGDLISGMDSSAEAKGESIPDSWAAFATQADILGIRTAKPGGPRIAAEVIDQMLERNQLDWTVPVINCGDGPAEHPTQALGDLFTISKTLANYDFTDMTLTVVGDHERYRAFHSLLIGAATVGMTVIAIESTAAQVPDSLVKLLGDKLTRSPATELDDALSVTDVLYMGRNPDEYTGGDPYEGARARELSKDYDAWIMTKRRLQQMPTTGIVLHPRPRRNELDPSCDKDSRMTDVWQMRNLVPMRAGIIARHLGLTIPAPNNAQYQ